MLSVVYDARVTGGSQRPDGKETIDVGWFPPSDLPMIDLGPFAKVTLDELRWLRPSRPA